MATVGWFDMNNVSHCENGRVLIIPRTDEIRLTQSSNVKE